LTKHFLSSPQKQYIHIQRSAEPQTRRGPEASSRKTDWLFAFSGVAMTRPGGGSDERSPLGKRAVIPGFRCRANEI